MPVSLKFPVERTFELLLLRQWKLGLKLGCRYVVHHEILSEEKDEEIAAQIIFEAPDDCKFWSLTYFYGWSDSVHIFPAPVEGSTWTAKQVQPVSKKAARTLYVPVFRTKK